MRILIAEEALQDGRGHWPAYIGTLSRGLRELGDEVIVLTHRDAGDAVCQPVGGTPWFSKNCWTEPASQGAVGGLRHNLTFGRELGLWLESHASVDWVCGLTMRLQHLMAYAWLSRSRKYPQTRFLLLFVQGFGVYQGPGNPTRFPKTVSTVLARLCFRFMRSPVRKGRVILAAETKGMQEELHRFTGLPVSLFPHPVPAPPEGAKGKGQGAEGEELRAEREVLRAEGQGEVTKRVEQENQEPGTKNKEPITISCPGFARHEKGSDLLLRAIEKILSDPQEERFHFVMQWPDPFEMPDGTMLEPGPEVRNDSRVEFKDSSLSALEYKNLLDRSDFVILPYRRASYHNRLSRVAIEAAVLGVPLIFMQDTWIAEVSGLVNCGEEIYEETQTAVEQAIYNSWKGYELLTLSAQKMAYKPSTYHSPQQFHKQLQEYKIR